MLSGYICGKRHILENTSSVLLTEPFVMSNTEHEVVESGPDIVLSSFCVSPDENHLIDKALRLFLYTLLGVNLR